MHQNMTDLPQSHQSLLRTVGWALLGISSAWGVMIATRGLDHGIQARDLWMLGVLAALGILPALRLLVPRLDRKDLSAASLLLMAGLFFVSGLSEGGSVLMWVAGAFTVYIPVLLDLFAPGRTNVPV